MPRTDYRLSHTLRVRWAEVDPQSIVFNPNYLMYFDVAVTEYFRELGYPYPDGLSTLGVDTFAVKATVEYHRSARFDDLIDVLVRCSRLGRTSMTVAIEIHRGDEHLVTGELVYVLAEPISRKPTLIPQLLRERIAAFEVTSPAS